MKIGDIIFVRSSSPFSWLIRWLTRSEYSHCAIYLTEKKIIEADALKRVKISKNRYHDCPSVDLCLNDNEKVRLVEYLINQIGKPYDYKQIAGLFLRLIGLSKKQNLWDSVNSVICSELIDRGYGSIGRDLLPDRLDGDCTPADLANALLGREAVCKCA
ncbi:C40 family peptidase [Cohnella kolymensis]|nr:hypothetical protein [Cohnella kolymensis]